MVHDRLNRWILFGVFALIPRLVYSIYQPTFDTICQLTSNNDTIVYSYQGADFKLPLFGTPSWQYIIEYHDIDFCQTKQHTLTILPISQPTIQYDTICFGETYIWNGTEYTTSGSYTDTLTTIYGCDSVVTLNLIVNPTYEHHDTIVARDSYNWHGTTYTTSGTYQFDTLTTLGCDSIEILTLTINYTTAFDTTIVACDEFYWLGKDLTTSGLYIDTLTNTTGCDSIVTLNLTINYTTTYDTTVVASDEFMWLGERLTTSGLYIDTLTNTTGCDSIITLNLTVNYTTTFDTTVVACDEFYWLGKNLTTSGLYIDTLTNTTGCDSIVTLNLTINYTTTYDTTVVACDEFMWLGERLTTSGVYVDTLVNKTGCDSIVTLNLTVNYTTIFDTTVVACDSYIWHGTTYTQSGVYEYLTQTTKGCDSLELLHLTIHHMYIIEQLDTLAGYNAYYWCGDTLYEAGYYTKTLTAITGCDSVINLKLIGNPVAMNEIIVPEYCAGDNVTCLNILTEGSIDYMHLLFSSEGHLAGFRDTIFSPDVQELCINIHDVRAGVYDANLVAFFHQEEVLSQSLTFKILYPTTIFEQRWNDLITILTAKYNGGYDFTAFQWYKDGELLHNETNSYLHQSLSFDSEYSVLLTDPNGQQLMSCPVVPVDLASISIYPTIVNAGEYVKCSTTEDATIMLYNSVGQVIGEYHALAGELYIEMPITSGMYMFKIITINNNQYEIKVFVR